MIEVKDLHKRFGKLEVLSGVSLRVPEGSVSALIGPSGGGKSTLLRCFNLLEVPDSGELRVGETSIDFAPHRRAGHEIVGHIRRSTGMVFQSFQLFPHRTALLNVMESLSTVLRWPKDKARARALELLDQVGLAHKADSYPGTLSGGQQQRVAIARALAASPRVLLCDEPTSALDPELAAEVVAVLRSLAHNGMTMLMATHDLKLAANIAHRVHFLEGGRVLESGSPKEIFLHPKQDRTRAFVATITEGLPEDWVI